MTEYTKKAAHRATIKSNDEKMLEQAIKRGFPNCKGTYPDCPENPNNELPPCKECPILEEILERDNY